MHCMQCLHCIQCIHCLQCILYAVYTLCTMYSLYTTLTMCTMYTMCSWRPQVHQVEGCALAGTAAELRQDGGSRGYANDSGSHVLSTMSYMCSICSAVIYAFGMDCSFVGHFQKSDWGSWGRVFQTSSEFLKVYFSWRAVRVLEGSWRALFLQAPWRWEGLPLVPPIFLPLRGPFPLLLLLELVPLNHFPPFQGSALDRSIPLYLGSQLLLCLCTFDE